MPRNPKADTHSKWNHARAIVLQYARCVAAKKYGLQASQVANATLKKLCQQSSSQAYLAAFVAMKNNEMNVTKALADIAQRRAHDLRLIQIAAKEKEKHDRATASS